MIRGMKSLGIIAEFNPFHQGHQYLIDKAMEETGSDVCVAVMSGNFTQRGIPAVQDKWTRAEAAVKQGVNLVVELPVVFSCSSAEYFARGGVDILEGFGCIDRIAFGSESGDIGELRRAADFLLRFDREIHQRVQDLVKAGEVYPKARQRAVEQIGGDFDLSALREPNNILAVEYLKRLRRIEPYTTRRKGDGYHQSASQIRSELAEREPERFARMSRIYWELVSSRILQTDGSRLEQMFSAGEGLGNKLKKEVRCASSAEQLIMRVKSKAYTHSRISRLLTQVLLDIDEPDAREGQPYIRVLAFDRTGAAFLKEMKKKECALLPVITNINKEAGRYPEIQKTLQKDILASDIYNIIAGKDLYACSDYVMRPNAADRR